MVRNFARLESVSVTVKSPSWVVRERIGMKTKQALIFLVAIILCSRMAAADDPVDKAETPPATVQEPGQPDNPQSAIRNPQSQSSDHWAFKTPVRPAVPQVKNAAWVRNPIDAFVLARLETEGLESSPEADRPTLIRRLSLDLIGLPPTPAEVDAFVNDASPYAYESLVNRLLASPHFGERWGRHWLDLAR
ncbi:MAG: DUF1549 domain-containing protein, partial [Candidatus Hydrogenedentes bacterium]|nr:DUF1549 domain-containing protein [Candidatus Hydrogenedentota bacterium]